MATEITTGPQGIGEVRTYYADYTPDLPSGVTIASAAAVHTPPSGAASTPTVGAVMSGDIVPVTLPEQTVTGRHILTITATLSNGDKSVIRLIIPVEWDVARSGMLDLIADLRGLANAGSNDYTAGGQAHWTDKQLERVLDRYRRDAYREPLEARETYSGGTVEYKNYYIPAQNLESGTAYFRLEDAAGNAVGTALYSTDYRSGQVTFSATTGGSAYYWTGRTYDLNRAAADVWRQKAAYHAAQFDFSTDNHSVKKSGVYKQCLAMAEFYEQRAATSQTVTLYRSDAC